MDFGLREWLIVIGLLVITGILFDGWRRMGGRARIRFKLERNLKDLPEPPDRDELLGPARVISSSEREEPSLGDDVGAGIDNPGLADRQPEQVGLDLDDGTLRADIPEPKRHSRKKRDTSEAIQAVETDTVPATERAPVEEVLVINVVARSEQGFSGAAMMQSVMESGLRFGEMNIFHRHESMTGNGDILFSMANALNPGIFDLDELDNSHVRAVSFFMSLPGPRHPKQALDLMIASARKLAQELGGDLKDESRSVLTAQTIEHYRQRIAEYERKRLGMRH
ncbi:MAG: cell division protein ZipA [Pseudomonas sp.]|jgi:cell division protein ZipA